MKLFENILNKEFIQQIIAHWGQVYFVGGCVRDHFLGNEPKDIDVVVRGLAYNTLIKILEEYGKVDTVGESFGVIKFKEKETGFEVEIALPRTDSKDTSLKGHKSIIAQSDPFLKIEDDLKRRDFTINSIAINDELRIIDPFNGLKDLNNKLIRATDEFAFIDDPLRMLRAIQFATRFNFKIEESTFESIHTNAELISEITSERILMEFQKVFKKKYDYAYFFELLKTTGLLPFIFGFPDMPYKRTVTIDKVMTLADFLYFVGEPVRDLTELPKLYGKLLKLDTLTVKQLKAIVTYFKSNETVPLNKRNKLKFMVLKIFPDAYALGMLKEHFSDYLNQKYPMNLKELAITGDDLILHLYVPEGHMVGVALDNCLDAVLEDSVQNNKQELIEFLKRTTD